MSVVGDNINVGESAIIIVDFAEGATGNIELSIAGTIFSHTISESDSGTYHFDLDNLSAGNHGFLVTYSGDANYKQSFASGSIEVAKVTPDVYVNTDGADGIQVGDPAVISVLVPEDATGTITVIVDGRYYTSSPVDGMAVFSISDLEAGEYTVDATYSGDDKYEPSSGSDSFSVTDI